MPGKGMVVITEAGKALADAILEKARENETIAKMEAVSYAKSNDPKYRVSFEKYDLLSNTYSNIHSLVCQGLHAVEAEMKKKGGAA